MATPVTDLEQRLHQAGFTPDQARAVASAFEALRAELLDVERRLSERIDDVERRLSERIDTLERRADRHEAMLRIVIAVQLVTLGAVLAPYVGRLFVAG